MDSFYKFILDLVKLIKPKHNNWVVSAFLVAGLGMVAQPWWIPVLNAALGKNINASSGIEIAGWICVALALAVHFINRKEEKRDNTKKQKLPRDKVRDYETLKLLLDAIHTPTFDEFIEKGKHSYVLDRIFHFWEGFRYLVEASSYHVYDSKLDELIRNLHMCWEKSLSFGEYFTPTNNSSVSRFITIMDTFRSEEEELAHNEFIQAIWSAEESLRTLLAYVREKYPDIDINETNATSWSEYISFMNKLNDKY